MHARLAENGIDPDSVIGLRETFMTLSDPFCGLETKFKQEKDYVEKLNLVVSYNCMHTMLVQIM